MERFHASQPDTVLSPTVSVVEDVFVPGIIRDLQQEMVHAGLDDDCAQALTDAETYAYEQATSAGKTEIANNVAAVLYDFRGRNDAAFNAILSNVPAFPEIEATEPAKPLRTDPIKADPLYAKLKNPVTRDHYRETYQPLYESATIQAGGDAATVKKNAEKLFSPNAPRRDLASAIRGTQQLLTFYVAARNQTPKMV